MNADCTVTEAGEQRLKRIGECFSNASNPDELEQCEVMAKDSGLDHIGQGVARTVYEADPEVAEGVDDGKCVVKFAKSRDLAHFDEGAAAHVPSRLADGQRQNKAEVADWLAVPKKARDEFVPIRDYDDEDYTWVTAPQVDPGGGKSDVQRVKERLSEADWHCKDIHENNIGKLETSEDERYRVIDYGLECMPAEDAS